MDWRKTVGLAAYVLLTGVITYIYFEAGEIFLGVAAPFTSGALLAVVTGVRAEFRDLSRDDVRCEIWISGILMVAPVSWYLVSGCVFGCPG